MNESGNSTKYGECRCCLTVGEHRDLMLEYEWNGTREVYFKIFLECFNLFLTTNSRKSTLICTSCILRLRDASSFKKMVLDVERNLLSYNISQDNSTVQLPNIQKSVENDEHEQFIEIKNEKFDNSEGSDVEQNVGNSDTDGLLEEDTVKINSKSYTDSIRDTFCKIKNNNRTEKLAYIYNACVILENSNATPFKPKLKTGFPCFYCRMLFDDLSKLREHQRKHTKTELKRVLRSYGAENFVVYVDVTDLKCTICNEAVPNLNNLKNHLIKEHKKEMQEFPDRVVPFKLTQGIFECQVCKCNFGTFGSIERHMNVHFRNYVCKECGTGYVTKCRLKVHSKQHVGGSFPCEMCKKVYTTPVNLKNHIDVVHKMIKRFKCAKCDERFTEYFKRQKHMVELHGVAPLEYKCNVCEKSFERKYMLSMHMKRDHLDERDFQCELCSYTCFTKNELKVHMIKHNGERIFECTVCKKSYARKKTLREHMRIHNNDKRYACKSCGQAFVQNCSLKGHIKTHHPELLGL
ncbi:gastrula zinc finger protein XlCGF26.1-like [Nymphalis io]|uniref:gastrula zinc finger protein XlCGF26.1-like n=1 Tax=Inachis io TaxID=171585 RepID=UPI002168AF7A|nr:gastrula zinc finger protein XlCGF26.1-like [Nymphalis io]